MAVNQIECSRPEQKSIIQFLVAEKGKPSEIYRKMSDVYRKTWFGKKQKMG